MRKKQNDCGHWATGSVHFRDYPEITGHVSQIL